MHELAGKGEEKSVLVVSTCPHLRITLEITAKKKKINLGRKKREKRKRGEKREEGRKGGREVKEGREGGRKKE